MNPKLKIKEMDINKWANKYDYSENEKELIKLIPKIRKKGYLSKTELKKVAYWKSPRVSGHIDKNDPAFVKEITKFSLNTKIEQARIEPLTLLSGVSWPVSSVILHFFHKAKYPILDFRALWSVGLEVPSQYTFDFWWEYVQFCRNISKKTKISMRKLDMALWQYSKENQKTD